MVNEIVGWWNTQLILFAHYEQLRQWVAKESDAKKIKRHLNELVRVLQYAFAPNNAMKRNIMQYSETLTVIELEKEIRN